MQPENTKEILASLLDKLSVIATSKTVIGEPVTIGEKIILPVVKLSLGIGGGSGSGGCGKGDDKQGTGSGAGAGAGLSITPIAFIVVDGGNIHLFGTKPNVWDNLTAKLPDLVSSIISHLPKSDKAKREDAKTGEPAKE